MNSRLQKPSAAYAATFGRLLVRQPSSWARSMVGEGACIKPYPIPWLVGGGARAPPILSSARRVSDVLCGLSCRNVPILFWKSNKSCNRKQSCFAVTALSLFLSLPLRPPQPSLSLFLSLSLSHLPIPPPFSFVTPLIT